MKEFITDLFICYKSISYEPTHSNCPTKLPVGRLVRSSLDRREKIRLQINIVNVFGQDSWAKR